MDEVGEIIYRMGRVWLFPTALMQVTTSWPLPVLFPLLGMPFFAFYQTPIYPAKTQPQCPSARKPSLMPQGRE